ncbi:hypothetical protein F5888DRAFT_1632968 [Russula emetica]|nr:hypothetical protein F5888DRAFT_1632968 [Russula emetica]
MSESSSDLEPIHAAHLPDRAFPPMTISLDGLRSAIDRADGSLRTVNGPSYGPIPLPPHHTTSPSPPADMNDPFNPRHYYDNDVEPYERPGSFRRVSQRWALESSAPNLGDFGASRYTTDTEPYPAWGAEHKIPLSKEEIEDISFDLQQKFGFQRDYAEYATQSSISRCTYSTAVRRECLPTRHSSLTPHADYIGGRHASYRKWYFAAQLDLDEVVGHTQNPGLQRVRSKRGGGRNHFT